MAGSVTQTLEPIPVRGRRDKYKLTLYCVADASGDCTGATTDDAEMEGMTYTEILKGKELVFAEVIPGSTTPTASYDVYVYDANDVDLFSDGLKDLTETVTSTAYPYNGTVYGSRFITTKLKPVVDNAGNAADCSIVLYFDQEKI